MSGDMPADTDRADSPEEARLRTRASLWSRLFMAGLSGLLVLGGLSCSSAQGEFDTPLETRRLVPDFQRPGGAHASRASYWEYNTGHGAFSAPRGRDMITVYGQRPSRRAREPRHHRPRPRRGRDSRANWTSGRIETRANRLFGAPPGGEMMVTASIKQPNVAHGLGYWPGFWMLGRGHWPGTGEVTSWKTLTVSARIPGPCTAATSPSAIPTGASGRVMRASAWAVACGRAPDARRPSTPTP